MRLQVTLNGIPHLVASLPGAGYLSAHLNLADRPKKKSITRKLRIEGFDTNSDTETRSIKWTPVQLSVGDSVQLDVLEDGQGDPPHEMSTTKEANSNLFSNEPLAKELLELEQGFEQQLLQFLKKVEKRETADEYEKFKRAVGHVVAELGERFLFPIYRRHANLIPEDFKGELL